MERRDLLALVLVPRDIAADTPRFRGQVASLYDSNVLTPASDFNPPVGSVQINWGDGTKPGAGQVVATIVPGVFEVDASHVFAKAGTFAVTVTVADGAGETATATAAAAVAAPPLTISGNAVTGTAGQPINPTPGAGAAVVATFIDPIASDSASMFNALISWGDGHASAGTVSGGNGVFVVTGTNVYSQPGAYPTTVTVVGNGLTATATGQALISAPVGSSFAATGLTFPATPGQPFTAVVATFTDPSKAASSTNPTAVIDWGDGNKTVGVVTPVRRPDGTIDHFLVTGTYQYASSVPAGPKAVVVTIADPAGPVTVASGQAELVNAGSGFVFSGALAPNSDTSPFHNGGFTNTDRPTFAGTAPPFSIVQLTARRIDVDATIPLGQAVTSSGGQWTLPSGPLADGVYFVTAVVTPPGGYPGASLPLTTANGQVVVDTALPRIVAVTPYGTSGQVLVTLRAEFSGMDVLTLLNPRNYRFLGPRGLVVYPASVTPVSPSKEDPGMQTILLTSTSNPKVRKLLHSLAISGAGLQNLAGTSIPSNYVAGLAAGSGHPRPAGNGGMPLHRRR